MNKSNYTQDVVFQNG